jgi:methyl-accepting chemotaxis protein
MTIRTKLLLGFGAMIVAMSGLGGLAYYVCITGSRSAEQLSEMTTDVSIGADLLEDLLMCRMNVKDYLIDNKQRDIEQYDQYRDRIQTTLRSCEKNFQDPQRRDWIADFSTKFAAYDTTFEKVKTTIAQRNTLITTQCDRLGAEMMALLDKTANDTVTQADDDSRQRAMESIRDSLRFRISVLKYIKTGEQVHYKNAVQELTEAQHRMANASDVKDSTVFTNTFDQCQRMLGEYSTAFQQIHGLIQQRNEYVLKTLDVIGPELAVLVNDIDQSLGDDSARLRDSNLDLFRRIRFLVLSISMAAVAFGVTAALVISRSIVGPVRELGRRLEDIAQGEGDLTLRVDQDRHDELGELGKWFNLFATRIHDVIAGVRIAAEEVADSTKRITNSNNEIADGMVEQDNEMSQLSATVEEMSASAGGMASSSAEAATRSLESGQNAESGGEVIRDAIAAMHAISVAVAAGGASVTELGKRAEKINEITNIISEIAQQTNLLALNAAIEAARAGEHGLGFAVVAQEIGKLATRTTEATDDIAALIKTIQQETGNSVDRFKVATREVETGVGKANDAGKSLNQIVASARDIAMMIQSIATAAEEQSTGAEQMAESLESVAGVTSQSAAGANETARASKILSEKAEHLLSLVGQFKVSRNIAHNPPQVVAPDDQ